MGFLDKEQAELDQHGALYKCEILGEFDCGDDTRDLMRRALALLVETNAEEFDRTLPGVFRGKDWIPRPELMDLSNRNHHHLSERCREACRILEVSESRVALYDEHHRQTSELMRLRQMPWWDSVWAAWMVAGERLGQDGRTYREEKPRA